MVPGVYEKAPTRRTTRTIWSSCTSIWQFANSRLARREIHFCENHQHLVVTSCLMGFQTNSASPPTARAPRAATRLRRRPAA